MARKMNTSSWSYVGKRHDKMCHQTTSYNCRTWDKHDEEVALLKLPAEIGDENGETTIDECKIRIKPLPHAKKSNPRIPQASVDLSVSNDGLTRKIKKMAEKEMVNLFNQLVEGKSINEFDVREIKGLLKLLAVMQTKLDERKKQLNKHVDENVANDTGANDSNVSEENFGHP
ncbi:hypothetical protein HAX54_041837 [Datura stramonium]|uniref:Uncharacterized protein n=1 Tax=Datura stramonium TaxID=4076 RepID=A0ABS8W2A0_DATST|nr:hypothetical protein [Datura stramonium]